MELHKVCEQQIIFVFNECGGVTEPVVHRTSVSSAAVLYCGTARYCCQYSASPPVRSVM